MTSRLRLITFWAVMIVLIVLLVEGAALIVYRVTNRAWFSWSKAAEAVSASAGDSPDVAVRGLEDLRMGDFVETLHPYLGFVASSRENKPEWKVSDYGFPLSDLPAPIAKRSPNKVIVGVFGGSFSQWIYLALKPLLEARGRETGKEYVVMNFGLGGYKQPQQLMALNYLLAMGAEFDVVINIDGFNEVALPVMENVPNKVNPFYPRRWDLRTSSALDASTVRLIGLREEAKQKKQGWAQAFSQRRLYVSPTLFLIWQARDRSLGRSIYSLNREIQAAPVFGPQSFAMRGPNYQPADPIQLYRDLAEVWKRSSLQMNNLCQANGIRYYNFLQPNQYLPGAKPIGAEEAGKAVNPSSPYKEPVERGYPELIRTIAELEQQGVKAIDLTQIFSSHPEPLYSDDCCHTNSQGSDIVAQRILEVAFPK